MLFKHHDLKIPENKPFSHCRLDREKYAKTLTEIINLTADGLVLAINNEWGTGKTTFVRMWEQQLKNVGYTTLYFNAWEHDFDNNPLVALLSELKSILPVKDNEQFKSLVKKGAVITKALLPALILALVKKHFDSETLNKVLEKSSEAAAEILQDEIEDYAQKKKGLLEFRNELEKFVKAHSEHRPMVFIVDELDRCRPDYAVQMLEHIKHFFNVRGIIFVLSIDKIQLGNAIRGFYGSDKIDADNYLRRFIDLEYSIPNPSAKLFCQYLYEYFHFADYLKHAERVQYRELVGDETRFVSFSEVLFEANTIPLRQIEKMYAHARIALDLFPKNNYVLPVIFLLLVYIKHINFTFYTAMSDHRLTYQEISKELAGIFPIRPSKDAVGPFQDAEVLLLSLYRNRVQPHLREKFTISDSVGVEQLTFTPRFFDNSEIGQFLPAVSQIENDHNLRSIKLDHILDKINLTGQLEI